MRVLLTCLAAPLYALGWLVGIVVWLCVFSAKSVATGYRQAVTRGAA